ncbi:MAG: alpha-1,2-fucosyltransferase [Bdellovibrionaceae bacterium]|nr:alpha-1,2-fucosyltransferase [Pseudobdellovibrionaceae bacterium]
MIVSYLDGGLGNQLFQYFCGYAASKRACVPWGLDTTSYQTGAIWRPFVPRQKRQLAIEMLGLSCPVVRPQGIPPRSRLRAILPYLPWIGTGDLKIHIESGFRFQNEFLKPADGTLLVGYFQSERYFVDFAEPIRTLFDASEARFLDSTVLSTLGPREDSVALHVRIGDYLTDARTQQVHGLLSADYYRRAIECIRQKVSRPRFLVFSDTPKSAVAMLSTLLEPGEYEVFSERGYSDLQEFFMMRACRHHVVANSSYSWWAAWSSQSVDGVKVAPAQWFAPQAKIDTTDLVPISWNRC